MEEEILRLSKECDTDDGQFIGTMEGLARRWGDKAYHSALLHLTGKSFDHRVARLHWENTCLHRETLPQDFGWRSALLDYLHRIVGDMHDPRILEAAYLDGLRHEAVTDRLTGLFQQVYFKSFLATELAALRERFEDTLAVVLLDLDHFKQYNDRCGHLAGDLVLTQVAEIIRDCTRQGDLAARYGGEEFILLLPQVDRAQAFKIAERIRLEVEKIPFLSQELLDSGNLTISGGIAFYPEAGDTADGLIAEADRQLYLAKGRRNAIFPAHSDQRREHRYKLRSVVEVAGEDGIFAPGLTFDLSLAGIRLGCGLEVSPGSELRLRFCETFWPRRLEIRGRVRHVQRPEGRMALIGLELNACGDLESFLPTRRGGNRHRSPSLPCAPRLAG